MTLQEAILNMINEAHQADKSRGIWDSRERLMADLLQRKRLDVRQGVVTDKNGLAVDLKSLVEQVVDSSYYIGRPANAAEKVKFVSQWTKPTNEERAAIARDVRKALDHLIKIHGIQFIDKESSEIALDTLSSEVVFGIDNNNELFFQKFSPSGLTGEQFFQFSDILSGILPQNLIDRDATSIQQELKNANLKDLAKKLLGVDKPQPKAIEQKVNDLRKQEILSSVPRRELPRIPRSAIEREFLNREALIRGIDPNVQVGQPRAIIQSAAKQEMMKLDDLTELKRKLQNIKPKPTEKWAGLPYE